MAIHAARLPARTPPEPRTPDWWPYAAEFPDWHAWRGVAGLLYARRPRSSPPKVVRGRTADELRDQIWITEGAQLRAADDARAELAQREAEQDRFGAPHEVHPASDSPPRWPGG